MYVECMFALGTVHLHSLSTVPSPSKNSHILHRIGERHNVQRPSLISKAKGQDADDKDER